MIRGFFCWLLGHRYRPVYDQNWNAAYKKCRHCGKVLFAGISAGNGSARRKTWV